MPVRAAIGDEPLAVENAGHEGELDCNSSGFPRNIGAALVYQNLVLDFG